VPKLLKVKRLTTSMRRWSVSLVQTFPLLCVPQRGLICLLQSDIGYVSMPQTSRLWPSPTPHLSSRSPNAPSTGPTEPNRRTLCSSIHHVIHTAIEPPFTRVIHRWRSLLFVSQAASVLQQSIYSFYSFHLISNRAESGLHLHAPAALRSPQAWPL
jgi:hypothetical protein